MRASWADRTRHALWPAGIVVGLAAEYAANGVDAPGRALADLATGWIVLGCGLLLRLRLSRVGDSAVVEVRRLRCHARRAFCLATGLRLAARAGRADRPGRRARAGGCLRAGGRTALLRAGRPRRARRARGRRGHPRGRSPRTGAPAMAGRCPPARSARVTRPHEIARAHIVGRSDDRGRAAAQPTVCVRARE